MVNTVVSVDGVVGEDGVVDSVVSVDDAVDEDGVGLDGSVINDSGDLDDLTPNLLKTGDQKVARRKCVNSLTVLVLLGVDAGYECIRAPCSGGLIFRSLG